MPDDAATALARAKQGKTVPGLLTGNSRTGNSATDANVNAADTTKAVALAWLLHLVGDIHQPLHCSSRVTPDEALPRGDAGGNTFRLDDNRNLHGYWDRILGEAIAPARSKRCTSLRAAKASAPR